MGGPDVSAFLPPRARRVVHFGCRNGRTAEGFRRIRPDCHYIGVALGEAGPDGLRPFPGEAFRALPGRLEPEGFEMGRADCILYEGEAIDCLTAEDLRRHGEALAPRGQMVLALENPAYFRRILGALDGEPVPGTSRRRLPELQTLLREAGLTLCMVRSIYPREDGEGALPPDAAELLGSLLSWQKARGGERPDPRAAAFLLVAVKGACPAPLVIQALLGEVVVTARVRMTEPHAFLTTEPWIRYQGMKNPPPRLPDVPEGARKILIRQRRTFGDGDKARRLVAFLRKRDYLLLFELDDNPARWQEDYEKSNWLDLRGCHACQVSTEPLAECLRQYNPHVKVFRNELRELPPRRKFPEGQPVTVFFGALNREEDWREILPVLNEAAERYGERLRFRVLADKAFFAALRTEHKEFIGDERYYGGKYVPYPVYADALHRSDISLLPLHDTEFNRMKSDLKFIESAGHGAAVLASPTVYAATVRDGETGFLYRSPREFAERLRILVEDRSRRLAMAESAYRYVAEERLLSRHYEERLAWYEELFARREELERDLDARLAKDWKKE